MQFGAVSVHTESSNMSYKTNISQNKPTDICFRHLTISSNVVLLYGIQQEMQLPVDIESLNDHKPLIT